MKTIMRLCLVLSIALIYFSALIGPVSAQSCGAGPVYYGNKVKSCFPANCIPGNPGCTCTSSCPIGHGGQITELCGDYSNNCSACADTNDTKSLYECASGSCNWGGSTASCSLCYTGWQNVACAGGSCTTGQMQQRNVAAGSPGLCSTQYRCVTNNYCNDPKAPSNPSGSCDASNQVNLSWTGDANATYYALRVNDSTTGGWDGTCSGGGDFCANVGPASYSFTGALNHTYDWWVHTCNLAGCSAATYGSTFSCLGVPPSSTPTPTSTPTPSPTQAAQPYFKVKNTSFFKLNSLNLTFPSAASMIAYDASDDIAGGFFDQGESGVVVSSGPTLSAGVNGTAISGSSTNTRNWKKTNTSVGNPFTSTSYVSYINTKKSATSVASLASIPASGAGGTYSLPSGNLTVGSPLTTPGYITIIVNGNLTLSTSDIGQDGITFIVTGSVLVNGGGAPVKFNSTNRPLAVISTGTITFADTLTEADGLYVGQAINFGTGSTPLKIIGNVSSSTASSFNRDRASNAPSMFIVFDPKHYINIIDKISVVKSSWTQIQ